MHQPVLETQTSLNECVEALESPAPGLTLYRRVVHPLLARTPTVSWCGEEGTTFPLPSCIILGTCLVQDACVGGGWGCSMGGDKGYVSAFSSLTYRAWCHSFMFQVSLEKLVRWNCLLLCKDVHGTGNTCFRKFHLVSIK